MVYMSRESLPGPLQVKQYPSQMVSDSKRLIEGKSLNVTPTALPSCPSATLSLQGSAVLWINLEMILSFQIVGMLTAQIGILRPELHPHVLMLRKGVKCKCDLCRKRVSDTYQCRVCDFDCCLNCFARKDRRRGEGGVRGDKGLREEAGVSAGTYFMRALQLVLPESPLFLSAFVCLAAASGAALLLPTFQGHIFDAVIAKDPHKFLHNVELAAGTSFLIGVFGGIRGLCFQVVGRRLAFRVRNALFKGIISQDIAFFDSTNTGDLTSRLSSDCNAMVAPCQTMLSATLQNLFSLAGGLGFCFYTSWKLSMLAFTTILPITYVTARYAKWSSCLNAQIYAELGQANTVAQEALGNIRTVRAFSTEALENDKYQIHTQAALAKGVRDALGAAGAFALNNNLDLGGGMLILWYGGWLVLHQDDIQHPGFTVGKLITFQLYFNIMQAAYKSLTNVVTSFTRAAGAATRVLSLMDSLPDIDSATGSRVEEPMPADLVLENVHFYYQMRPDSLVIAGVSLHIPAGKVCALVGRSGGGKSTLVHLLLRYYDPTEGRILLDGRDLRSWSLQSVHSQLGLVSQDTQMFASTILENISYGCSCKSVEEVQDAAKKASAHEFITHFPDGYETLIGERGIRLSGGQKQRLAIARAFLRRPRLLLLDEATSALDAESEHQVQSALDVLMRDAGCTVVLVAHRLSTVVNAHLIAVVDNGKVVEKGTHLQLLQETCTDSSTNEDASIQVCGVYARLVSRQLAKQANLISSEVNPARCNSSMDNIEKLLNA
eukprot:CAMPEP_0196597224 /NCGR_PEP_ID=MMETSP1081-20130531/90310_1 /TAXON_ID=36882 /ORGANISM="Pyramimonas amylifera, Strain CCMP720" /LENGTH=775 /DNA_ID=CAMNT_0041922543 /DNA_START=73 /DNA_END=2400 /DNA_ORIENTATION=-